MKTIILLLFTSALSCFGQTVTTNWIQAASNFREVNGKLFNIDKSTNWASLDGLECLQVAGKDLIAWKPKTISERSFNRYVSGGNFLGTGTSAPDPKPVPQAFIPEDAKVLIRNYPTNQAVFSGSKFTGKAMFVGIKEGSDGSRLAAWDCGTPHLVMVVQTNLPGR